MDILRSLHYDVHPSMITTRESSSLCEGKEGAVGSEDEVRYAIAGVTSSVALISKFVVSEQPTLLFPHLFSPLLSAILSRGVVKS